MTDFVQSGDTTIFFQIGLFFAFLVLAFGLYLLKISRMVMPADAITGDWLAAVEQRLAALESQKPIAASVPKPPTDLPPAALPLRMLADTIQGVLMDIESQQWDSAADRITIIEQDHPYLPIVEFLRGRMAFAMLAAATQP